MEGTEYVLDEFEFSILYPNVPFDSVTIEERTINTESPEYKKLTEITIPESRQAGSPPTGEIDPASFNQRANEIMSNPNLPTFQRIEQDGALRNMIVMKAFINLRWMTLSLWKRVIGIPRLF